MATSEEVTQKLIEFHYDPILPKYPASLKCFTLFSTLVYISITAYITYVLTTKGLSPKGYMGYLLCAYSVIASLEAIIWMRRLHIGYQSQSFGDMVGVAELLWVAVGAAGLYSKEPCEKEIEWAVKVAGCISLTMLTTTFLLSCYCVESLLYGAPIEARMSVLPSPQIASNSIGECNVCGEGIQKGQAIITLHCEKQSHTNHAECMTSSVRMYGVCPRCQRTID